jgi:glucose uptake protein
MILPHTDTSILLLLVLGLFCLGSWANTFKLAGGWRFELYYFDFAFGLMLFTLILGLTAGNLGYDGFGLQDSIMNAGKQQWLYAFAAGVVFNLGNLLLIAVVATAGMALAFPVALGTALILTTALGLAGPGGSTLHLAAGCVLVAAAMAADAFGYNKLSRLRHEALAKAGKVKSTRRPDGFRQTWLALVSGLMLGCFVPLFQKATIPDIGLGPYAVWLFFSVGVVSTTLAVGMFLLNLSTQGEELSIPAFIKSRPTQHLLGLAGGGLWLGGTLAVLVATFANNATGVNGGLPAGAAQVSRSTVYALRESAPILAALWGIVVWKEGKGGDSTVRLLTAMTVVLFAAGVAMIAL